MSPGTVSKASTLKGRYLARIHPRSSQLVCVLSFCAVAALGSYWTHLSQTLVFNEQQLLISEVVNVQASAIERRLARSLSATHILALEIQQNGGLFDAFEGYAQAVLDSVGGISNLQLAPAGIIQKIHPLSGNEKALGHNILRDDRRRKEAQLALQERRLTLAGPFTLVQGGVAVIGRYPVFLAQAGRQAGRQAEILGLCFGADLS
ncbi:MAG: CHASE domain-containing protein [Motiliproteus sp.]